MKLIDSTLEYVNRTTEEGITSDFTEVPGSGSSRSSKSTEIQPDWPGQTQVPRAIRSNDRPIHVDPTPKIDSESQQSDLPVCEQDVASGLVSDEVHVLLPAWEHCFPHWWSSLFLSHVILQNLIT